MKFVRNLALVIAVLIFSFPQSGTAQISKSLSAKKVSAAPIVDGSIDPVWSVADSTTIDFQLSAHYAKPPSERTIVKVLSTEDALFFLFVCYDKHGVTQKRTGMLDASPGDAVVVMLDTFGDRRTAYMMAVNAGGSRDDCRMLDDARNRDYSWDGVWFAGAAQYDWGYAVEMEIPYRSLQYDGSLATWGLDFNRWIPLTKEDIYWCEYEQNEGQRVSKFGTLSFDGFHPEVRGNNVELYPVGISKTALVRDDLYKNTPNAGLDIFYNPSSTLTFLFTANPDFAQIEADPYSFNISRYESYFNERRPFFTEGNEVFSPSGRQQNTGFYRPMELFYSRRIGKLLSDGTEVPLIFGAKAFGRYGSWEYGGFAARTAATDYINDGTPATEEAATFAAARLKKQIFENSSLGMFVVGKQTPTATYGVLDVDGALRTSQWQLAYQFAQSYTNTFGGFATSLGFTSFGATWLTLARLRTIASTFDASQIGFVPWRGTTEFVGLTGPRWYFEEGYVSSVLLYAGPALYYEKVDGYTDHGVILGYNMQFRSQWGLEVNLGLYQSRDQSILYTSREVSFSTWFSTSPSWFGNVWGNHTRTYNFSRNYLGAYTALNADVTWQILDEMRIGTYAGAFAEWRDDGVLEELTVNTRPFISVTPWNDVNFRLYVDNTFLRSTGSVENVIVGFLFAYNFSPKSWIYLATNEVQDRAEPTAPAPAVRRLNVRDRAAVLKVKYCLYF